MKQTKVFLVITVLVLLINICGAAEIKGRVVNFALERVNNAIITINTVPQQRVITDNGEYLIEVPTGNYTLTAKELKDGLVVAETSIDIAVVDQGSYRLDIILFPNVTEGQISFTDVNSTNIIGETNKNSNHSIYYIGAFIMLALLIVLIGIYFYLHKKEPQPKHIKDELKEKAMQIISEKKRIMQKELRQILFVSEPEISMLLSELEAEGKIRKIKKGRSNLIVFNRN